MKRKVFWVVLLLMLGIFLFGGCCCLFQNLSADVVITKWEQDYSNGKWSDQVKVYYTITNTGNVDIGYYCAWLVAYCDYEDSCKKLDIYEYWDNVGTLIEVGESKNHTCWMTVGDKKVTRMNVPKILLERYIGFWQYEY